MSQVRCCLAIATGWTLDYIDSLEWPDVIEFNEYFVEHPPAHLAIDDLIHAMGFKRVRKQPASPSIGDLQTGLPGGNSEAKHFNELPPTVQQWLSTLSGDHAGNS